ncbi:2-hydroxychromene-2-carboxylate isomerase [Oceanicaulis sp. LC35]|uniref:2-hydroxychromene-2-carboxylate isomerase n=1 Tax=Oceanicaulis sp. LC35 TaxID=3349635 RepID=UPI003F8645F5
MTDATPLSFDLYWSFRSPYSYIAAQRFLELRQHYAFNVNVRIVRPLAVRSPEFFEERDPRWIHYVIVDVAREAERLGLPISAPSPDPIVQDIHTLKIAPEQPRIAYLNQLGVLACEDGDGLAYIAHASRRIWGGSAAGHDTPWTEDGALDDAARAAGLDPDTLNTQSDAQSDRIDSQIIENEANQDAAGHWGVPLMVFQGEPFFGQDRIDALLWRMQQRGLKAL